MVKYQVILFVFGNTNDTDLEKDYFTKSTDFGVDLSNGKEAGIGLYYNHGWIQY